MNFDQRSRRLNTEIGLIIDSAELAAQTAARFEAMTQPANAYAVSLRSPGSADSPLVWRTEENGKVIEYLREPSRSMWRRVAVRLYAALPLDKEL
jgi:putative cardiolipin synthase